MYRLQIIKHSLLSEEQLSCIINQKNAAWKYSLEQHTAWIDQHISPDDLHVILWQDQETRAYMNLVEVCVNINGQQYPALGIGNVCATRKGKGYGTKLMELTNHFLEKNNRIGLLFCKSTLISFYRMCGWKLIEKELLSLNFDNTSSETMIYNYHIGIKNLEYNDKLF